MTDGTLVKLMRERQARDLETGRERGLIWDGPLPYVRCFKSRITELEFRETKRDK